VFLMDERARDCPRPSHTTSICRSGVSPQSRLGSTETSSYPPVASTGAEGYHLFVDCSRTNPLRDRVQLGRWEP
jgi:hypothetical protein